MRRRTVSALLVALVAVTLFVVACAGPPAPRPNPAAQGALQRSDVPAGWARCAASGSLGHYLPRARKLDAASAGSVAQSWAMLRKLGATRAEVIEFVAQRADCSEGLGETAGASALTWTVAYRSPADAQRAYERGVLGFPTPDAARLQPGLTVGTSTGLGADSWTLTQTTPPPPLFVAWWCYGSLTDFLIVSDLATTQANPIALRVDARMEVTEGGGR